MRIGIGITTYKRPLHLQLCLNQIKKHTSPQAIIYVADDSYDRRGIAYRKTECIDVLWKAGCDYFVLFDDDCFPIADHWIDQLITASQITQQEHLNYIDPQTTIKITNGLRLHNKLQGVMMFMTRELVRCVGGLSLHYGIYGHEHVTYTNRIHEAGFTTPAYGRYLSLDGIENFLYAMDFNSHLSFNSDVKHKSSVTKEEARIFTEYNKNQAPFDTKNYYPLPSKQVGISFSEPLCFLTTSTVYDSEVNNIRQQFIDRGYPESNNPASLCLIWGLKDWSIDKPLPLRYIAVQVGSLDDHDQLFISRLQGALQVWDSNWSHLESLQRFQIFGVYLPVKELPWEVIEKDYLDLNFYGSYPDLIQHNIKDPEAILRHWENFGKKEHRLSRCPPGLDWTSYLEKNPDLVAHGINTKHLACQHWINFGKREGRLH